MAAQQLCCFLHTIDQGTRVIVSGRAFHPGIAKMAEAAQLDAFNAQGIERMLELPSAEPSQLICFREALVGLADDFALLPQRRGNHGDLRTARGQVRQRAACKEHLIIRVRVNGHDTVAGEILIHHLSSTAVR